MEQALPDELTGVHQWLGDYLLTPPTFFQLIALVVSFMVALGLTRLVRPYADRLFSAFPFYERVVLYGAPLLLPLFWLLIVAGVRVVFEQLRYPVFILAPAMSLLVAWLVIRLASHIIRNPEIGRFFAVVVWVVAALNIAGLLDPILAILDAGALKLGETRVSALDVLTGLLSFTVLVWLALLISRLLEQSFARVPTLTPSAQVLLGKLTKIFLVTIAILMAITSSGIDLTALAVVGGAVGLGLGFGLQKVISNLISGVILLMDRSIKPGDVIEVGETYGWINKLAARYTSVITRDGREHLIPNEDMITRTVVNWTYSNTDVRRHIFVPVSYKSDVRLAIKLAVEAAGEVGRVLASPEPNCLVRRFGERAIELELRVWINDPHSGVENVASEILLKIWDKYIAHGIEIPYPQHDLHLVSAPALKDEAFRDLLAGRRNAETPAS